MTLKQKQDEEAMCDCAGKVKFKQMTDCDHIITTDPEVIKEEFPALYNLCKNGGKFRVQTKVPTKADFYEAIQQFRTSLEHKYGKKENELLSWCQLLKSILTPLFELASHDKAFLLKKELAQLQKKYIITQVDKDSNGIAFICKKVAHKLTKRFIYGPNPNTTGLFQQDVLPLTSVIENLKTYCNERGIFTKSRSLPQFKITMKMHKTSWKKAGRPISSEKGSILQKLTKMVSAALLALRPTFQRRFQQILRYARIHVEDAFSGTLVTLDGEHGVIRRIRAVNRWIQNNFQEHKGLDMATFDLSECYSKLDQLELLRVISRMINIAFTGKRLLAVIPFEKSGRWINSESEALPREKLFTAETLEKDVRFLTTNAYIE